jgi:hypothetical protein
MKRALMIREQELGAAIPTRRPASTTWRLLSTGQGKYGEAEPLYQCALVICEQSLSRNHFNTRICRKKYAFLLQTRGRDAEAK